MKRWIAIVIGVSVGLVCWVSMDPPAALSIAWAQSSPDLDQGPPEERIQPQSPLPSPPPLASPTVSPALEETESESAPPENTTLESNENTDSERLPNLRAKLGRPGIIVTRTGNLQHATVKLDGYALIEVAAEVPRMADTEGNEVSPVRFRVERIQDRLQQVVFQLFNNMGIADPSQIQVSDAVLNNEVVLVLVVGDRRPALLTVTQVDADLAGTTIADLADQWEEIVTAGLRRAWQERQPGFIHRQLRWSGLILVATMGLSLSAAGVQGWMKRVGDDLNSRTQAKSSSASDPNLSQEPMGELSDSRVSFGSELDQRQLRHRQDLLLLLRRFLSMGQIILWVIAITRILMLFPQTRELGLEIFGIPFYILILILIVNSSSRILKVIIDYHFGRWLEEKMSQSDKHPRLAARAQTCSLVFRDVVDYLGVVFFILALLYILEIPLVSALTGAGVVGIFLSLAAQSMIKNFLAGMGVLFEDQYVLGDWVTINDSVCGVVENIDLIYTKIRDMNGSVVTIANGGISKVENMTVDWARVFFLIDVAYQTDIDLALRLLQKESETLAQDPDWKRLILNPVELIGVDRLAHDGMRLRLWIQTQAGWQWPVERELRRRLRKTFEQHGISIGIPQQQIPQLNRLQFAEDR